MALLCDRRTGQGMGIAVVAALAASGGCASARTHVVTSPPGAQLSVDGKVECLATPCTWTTERGLPRRHRIQIEKPGFAPLELAVGRDLTAGWMIGTAVFGAVGWVTGIGVLVPAGLLFGLTRTTPPADLELRLDPLPALPQAERDEPAATPELKPSDQPAPAPEPKP